MGSQRSTSDEYISRDRDSLLMICDAGDILVVGQAVLSPNWRMLLAWDAPSALWSLERMTIQSALIQEGMPDFSAIEAECHRRGVRVDTMKGILEEGIVRLVLPDWATRPAPDRATSAARSI